MLCIEREVLADSDLAYIAMRLSFFETLERVALAEQMGLGTDGLYGYLSEVPYLRHVASHVQLDLLLACWQKLRSDAVEHATLVDESVIYAACEAAARIAEYDAEFAARYLATGPRRLAAPVTDDLADQLRFLHLSLPNEGHFLLLSQFQDLGPDEGSRLKSAFGIDPQRCEPMFEVIGRWHLSTSFRQNAEGLLDAEETVHAAQVLGWKRLASPL